MIGNHYVEPPERRDRGHHQLLRGGGSRKSDCTARQLAAPQFPDEVFGWAFRRLIVEDNFRARRGKHPYCGSTDSAEPPRNKRDFELRDKFHKSK